MANKDTRIIIIGAGVSGLVAAIELEKKGFAPLIIERSDKIGGRLKTDLYDNTPLDHGFQVYLTAYEIPKQYLDINKLELIEFLPGSLIITREGKKLLGDPSRSLSFIGSLFSNVSSFSDKIKTYRLANKLKSMSIEEIFQQDEVPTIQYLSNLGFSKSYIDNFFLPFFSGIFLENELETSSNKFCFIFKMFSEGNATLPKKGMEEIPKQLKSQLKKSDFIFNTEIKAINENTLIDAESNEYEFDKLIVASSLNLKEEISWHDCLNVYFKIDGAPLNKKIIGLLPGESSFINNFHYLDDIFDTNSKLISITVVDLKGQSEENVIEKVKSELKDHLGIQSAELIKSFYIKEALPNVKNKNKLESTQIKISDNIYQAGDQSLMGTLNHAFLSGRDAALAVINDIQN